MTLIRCAHCTCAISQDYVYTLQTLTYHMARIPLDLLFKALERYRTKQGEEEGKVQA